MRIKDVRLGPVSAGGGIVHIREKHSLNFVGKFWPTAGLNRRQTFAFAEKMCNIFNAEQTYGKLEKKKR